MEFIFIDDCTPDRSMEVLENVIERNSQRIADKRWSVRTIHLLENSGQAVVRQRGLQVAEGQYVAHCDSDDWGEPDMLQILFETAQKSDAEIVYGNFYFDDGINPVARQRFSNFCSDPKTLMRRMMTGSEQGSVWCALCKRSVAQENIIYPTGNMGEDLALNIQYLYNATRPVALEEKPLYHYFFNTASISNNQSEANIERNFRLLNMNADVVEDFFGRNGASEQYRPELKSLRLVACRPLTPLLLKNKYYRLWRQKTKTIKGNILTDNKLPLSVRLHYLCSLLRIIPILSFFKHKFRFRK